MKNMNESEKVVGEQIFEYLLNQKKESSFLDFKHTIDIRNNQQCLKVIKDVLAFTNTGGGWILFGVIENDKKSNISGKFIKNGYPVDFNFDDASLQEKINAYIQKPIKLEHGYFERTIDMINKKFVLLYIQPTHKILKAKKDGVYHIDGKIRFAFKKDITYTRRGTQCVPASKYEIEEIKKNILNENYELSILNGNADDVDEVLHSNLFKVKKIPKMVYIGKTKYENKYKLDNILQKKNINFHSLKCRLYNKKIVTFKNLHDRDNIFNEIVYENEIQTDETKNWLNDDDRSNIIMQLLNEKFIDLAQHNKIKYDRNSKKFFYTISNDENIRNEKWLTRHGRISIKRTVNKIYDEKLGKMYVHEAVNAKIIKINDALYLKINPTKLITLNKKNPEINTEYGPIITKESYRIYNQQYLNSILFWINKLENTDEFNNELEISNTPIKIKINKGIRHDIPVTDLKEMNNVYEDMNTGDIENV